MSEQAVEPQTPDAATAPDDAPDASAKPDVDWKAKAREWEKRAKENSKAAEELNAVKESQKTEAQKLAERAEAAEARANQAEQRAVRLQVISETGLPANLHKFVVGSDEAELRANAQELLEQFSAERRTVDVGQGPRGTEPVKDINAQLRRAAGRA